MMSLKRRAAVQGPHTHTHTSHLGGKIETDKGSCLTLSLTFFSSRWVFIAGHQQQSTVRWCSSNGRGGSSVHCCSTCTRGMRRDSSGNVIIRSDTVVSKEAFFLLLRREKLCCVSVRCPDRAAANTHIHTYSHSHWHTHAQQREQEAAVLWADSSLIGSGGSCTFTRQLRRAPYPAACDHWCNRWWRSHVPQTSREKTLLLSI